MWLRSINRQSVWLLRATVLLGCRTILLGVNNFVDILNSVDYEIDCDA
jgi:hypothetical protein